MKPVQNLFLSDFINSLRWQNYYTVYSTTDVAKSFKRKLIST